MRSKLTTTEYQILLSLANHPNYGYQLFLQLNKDSVHIARSSLYTRLRRLNCLGYIQSTISGSAVGPTRQYYHVTTAGRRRISHQAEDIQEQVRELEATYQTKLAVLRKLAFITK